MWQKYVAEMYLQSVFQNIRDHNAAGYYFILERSKEENEHRSRRLWFLFKRIKTIKSV